LGLILSPILAHAQTSQEVLNLEDRWDTERALENPDKGWYHHILDNGVDKYHVSDPQVLEDFPGMDHIYIRLAWSFLEPEEGEYDWSRIDKLVDEYVPRGIGVSFRISSKERGGYPETVPQRVDGVKYATPHWVREAGAEGTVVVDEGTGGERSWAPDWDDPVYLEKLSNFHEAFAQRYGDKPWVRYLDIGSIGDYGEGHTNPSTGVPPTKEEVKANMDLYLEHYDDIQIVATDALHFWNKPDTVANELANYGISNGITIRDDSPLVEWHVNTFFDTWSVSNPHFFDKVYKDRPTVFELQHYSAVKDDGNWLGKNGQDTIPDLGVSGADIFRNAMKLIHPTYIGYHGYAEEWLKDNPELTRELLNLSGYWYFPKSFRLVRKSDTYLSFTLRWLNKGVAPAYNTYQLKGKLVDTADNDTSIPFTVDDSGNTDWMPGQVHGEIYTVLFEQKLEGRYGLAIKLYDKESGEPVEIGLREDYRDDDGYYHIQEITF
jgi:hypothetical protein